MNAYGFRGAAVLAAVCALGLMAGCAQTGGTRPAGGSDVASSEAPHECNPGVGAAIGAIAGSFFGKGKGHIAGAAIGAGIGAFACMAYNYHARKIRDARAVEAQYRHERGALPASNTVEAYQSELVPGQAVQPGGKATMQSRITVLQGTHGTSPQLQEQLTLFSPEGKELTSVTKDATAIDGTGEYETNFDFNLPKGIQEGRYTMQSALYMNGQKVRTNKVPMLVVA